MEPMWKDLGMFDLNEAEIACQVKNFLKTGKLSKVEIECIKHK